MSTLKMSRDTRKIQDFLNTVQSGRSVSALDAYLTDLLMMRYTPTPIIGMLKTKIRQCKRTDDRYATIEYWLPYLTNVLKSGSATRQSFVSPTWQMRKDTAAILPSYEFINTNYLISDYGYDEMISVLMMTHVHQYTDIVLAIKTAKASNVYNAKYLQAILEKELALKKVHDDKINQIAILSESSNKLLDVKVHKHSVLDMAQMMYNWDNARENQELEKKFRALTPRELE